MWRCLHFFSFSKDYIYVPRHDFKVLNIYFDTGEKLRNSLMFSFYKIINCIFCNVAIYLPLKCFQFFFLQTEFVLIKCLQQVGWFVGFGHIWILFYYLQILHPLPCILYEMGVYKSTFFFLFFLKNIFAIINSLRQYFTFLGGG